MTGTETPTALDAVRTYAHAANPSAFLALNEGNSYFTIPGTPGVIAYRTGRRHLVQFGGPFAPDESYADLLAAFHAFAREGGRRVVAVQLQRTDAERYAQQGFTVNQIGASYALDLARFSLRGSAFVRLRNKVSRSFKAGLTVHEADADDHAGAVHELDESWLRGKGKHAKPLEFLVGQLGGPVQEHRRLFVGELDGRLAGYISFSPVYGEQSGWLHDLSRRLPDGPPGIMEAINTTAIDTFRAEGAGWLHFGFTPFTGLDPELEVDTSSRWFSWLVGQLAKRGAAVYPAVSQLAYKQKWKPHAVLPEYVAFSGRASLGGFLQVFKTAGAL
jgi:lysylphosphatidylglycerol synthetase-like protein (DUF2156 family)